VNLVREHGIQKTYSRDETGLIVKLKMSSWKSNEQIWTTIRKNIEYNGLVRNKIGLIIGFSDFMELYEQIGVSILVNGHDKLL
jgi:hypothetical protein